MSHNLCEILSSSYNPYKAPAYAHIHVAFHACKVKRPHRSGEWYFNNLGFCQINLEIY